MREPIRAIRVTPGIARTTLTNCKTARRRCSRGDGSGGMVRLDTAITFTSATRTWSIACTQLVVIQIQLRRKIRTENLRDDADHVGSAIPRRNRNISKNVGGNCSADLRVTPKVTPTNVWSPLGATGPRWTCKQQIHSTSQSVARQSRRLKTSVDVCRLGPGSNRTWQK